MNDGLIQVGEVPCRSEGAGHPVVFVERHIDTGITGRRGHWLCLQITEWKTREKREGEIMISLAKTKTKQKKKGNLPPLQLQSLQQLRVVESS